MLKNKMINLGVVKKVAHVLGELNDHVAYVGGATVSIYADDPAADDVRPTKDVDIVLQVISFGELTALQQKLAKKGIYPDSKSNVACRFQYDDILIDVMSTKEVGWAPSDPWFEPGFKSLLSYEVDDETRIMVFPVFYFLATKFSAFKDRGEGDPRTSKDFEDIVYVLDNRLDLVNEINTSPQEVKTYLKSQLEELLKDHMNESLSAHLSPFSKEERLSLLKEKINSILISK